jgi:hypothetical protein
MIILTGFLVFPEFVSKERFNSMFKVFTYTASSMATRQHPSQTNFIDAILSLHICAESTLGAPQKLHFFGSPQGLHKCPGSFATAPQFLHVYAIIDLLYESALTKGVYRILNKYDFGMPISIFQIRLPTLETFLKKT